MPDHDSIETASRRLAISFLKYRNGAEGSIETYAGDDLLDIPKGCTVVVSVKLVRPDTNFTTWAIPELAELEGAAV